MENFFYPSHYCFLDFQPSLVVTLPHIWRVYMASQVYPLITSYGSNWGHKIADSLLYLISTLKLLFLQTIAFIKLALHNL